MSIYPKYDSSNIFNNDDIKSPEELNNNNSNNDSDFDHSLYINRHGDQMSGELEIQTLKFNDDSIQSKAFSDEDKTNINNNKDKLINISASTTETIIPYITTDRILLRDINGDQNLTSIDKIKIYENAGNIILNTNKLLNVTNDSTTFIVNSYLKCNKLLINNEIQNQCFTDSDHEKINHFNTTDPTFYIYTNNNRNLLIHPGSGYIHLYSDTIYIGNANGSSKISMNGAIQNYAFTDNDRNQIETNKNNVSSNSNNILSNSNNIITNLNSINQNSNDIIDNSNRISNIETNIVLINELPISTDINNNFIINTPTIVDEIHIKFLYFDTHSEYQGQPFKNSHALQISLNKTSINNNTTSINNNTTNISNNYGYILINVNKIASNKANIDLLKQTKLGGEINYNCVQLINKVCTTGTTMVHAGYYYDKSIIQDLKANSIGSVDTYFDGFGKIINDFGVISFILSVNYSNSDSDFSYIFSLQTQLLIVNTNGTIIYSSNLQGYGSNNTPTVVYQDMAIQNQIYLRYKPEYNNCYIKMRTYSHIQIAGSGTSSLNGNIQFQQM